LCKAVALREKIVLKPVPLPHTSLLRVTSGINRYHSVRMLIAQSHLTFLDFETTGIDARGGERVCEVGILRCFGLQIEKEYSSLVNPQKHISAGASAVNGITDDMVNGAPCFSSIAPELLSLMENSIIVCHNAPFDLSFLCSELLNNNMPMIENYLIDTLSVARKHFHFPSNKLQSIASGLGIDPGQKHRALADVHTTRQVLQYYIGEIRHRMDARPEEILISGKRCSELVTMSAKA